jgi:hypothetical protein
VAEDDYVDGADSGYLMRDVREADPMDWVRACPRQLYIWTEGGLVRGRLGFTPDGSLLVAEPEN